MQSLLRNSQRGKIIRTDNKSSCAAGRGSMDVKLLDLKDQDEVAAAIIPPEEAKPKPKRDAAAVNIECSNDCAGRETHALFCLIINRRTMVQISKYRKPESTYVEEAF